VIPEVKDLSIAKAIRPVVEVAVIPAVKALFIILAISPVVVVAVMLAVRLIGGVPVSKSQQAYICVSLTASPALVKALPPVFESYGFVASVPFASAIVHADVVAGFFVHTLVQVVYPTPGF